MSKNNKRLDGYNLSQIHITFYTYISEPIRDINLSPRLMFEDGLMLLYETDENGNDTGRFLGSYSGGVYQGQFTTQGRKMPFRLSE